MGSYEEWTQANEEDARARESEFTGRSERGESVLKLLSVRLSAKRLPEQQTPEQREALAQVAAALDDYMLYFYPPESR